MRLVLDTNVVVSAAFFGGQPRAVVDAWIDGRVQVAVSPSIFDEYLQVCQRLSERHPSTDYRPLLTAFVAHGLLIPDGPVEAPITEDPDDDKFLVCALAANATVVSGDRHLLEMDGWRGVSVLTPAHLLTRLLA